MCFECQTLDLVDRLDFTHHNIIFIQPFAQISRYVSNKLTDRYPFIILV